MNTDKHGYQAQRESYARAQAHRRSDPAIRNQKSKIINHQFPHFLEYDPLNVDNPRAPYAVLPVPYERTVSFGHGTARAPAAIMEASTHIEPFDEEILEPLHLGVQTLPAIPCRRRTDRQVLETIRRTALESMQRGQFLLALGGEHTITFPLVAAAVAAHGDLTVLHFDAHLDLRDRYTGTSLSHGCVMRRVLELGMPIVSVGIRSICAEEFRIIKQYRLPVFWARDIIRARSETWMNAVLARLGKRVYITLDIDSLDPALMPGTGTPEPGGLDWYAVTALIRRVCAARRVVAADLVEVVPVPGTPSCEYTAARLATKLMLYHRVGMERQAATKKNAQRRIKKR